MARSLYTNLRQRYGTPSAPDVIARKTSEIIDRLSRSEYNFKAKLYDKSVIVVGGGLAGLRAAECLRMAGFQVTLLEAKARVGGRVRTQKISGHLIEAGAELIGQIHPRVLKMAMDFKLGLSLIATEDHYAVMRPEVVSSKNGHELYKQLDAVLMKLSTYAHDVFGRSSPHKPWTLRDAEQLDERSLASWLDEHAPKGQLRDDLEYQFSNDNCTATKNQSLLAVLAQVRAGEQSFRKGDFWKKVEVFRCRRGNQAIADKLYERLSSIGIALHRKTPARQIYVTDSGVDVRADNGFSIRGDYCVLAVPPWVWPTILPEQPLLSVAGGPAVKHMTVVRDQFWLPNAPTSHGPDGLTWEGTNNQVTSSNLVFSIFAGGDAAQRALDAADVNAHYEDVIRQRFPEYNGAIGKPRFVPWPLDPGLKSGYSCPSPGDVCKNGPVLNDLWKERVAFAGEHVSMGYWGYMEGALWSGEHAAQRIVEQVALG